MITILSHFIWTLIVIWENYWMSPACTCVAVKLIFSLEHTVLYFLDVPAHLSQTMAVQVACVNFLFTVVLIQWKSNRSILKVYVYDTLEDKVTFILLTINYAHVPDQHITHLSMFTVISGFPQRLENLENENGHGKVMEHEKLAKSHEQFSDQLWNFTNFALKLCQISIFLVITEKLSSYLESLHFPMFSAKRRECKIGKKDQEMVMEKS